MKTYKSNKKKYKPISSLSEGQRAANLLLFLTSPEVKQKKRRKEIKGYTIVKTLKKNSLFKNK